MIDDANSSVDATGKYTFAVTKGGYKADPFTFESASNVTEGYIVTIDGEEKILANAAATITESNNMKITAPDGTVRYAKTVTIDANGYVIEKGYSVTVTVDGEPQYFKAVGQQKAPPMLPIPPPPTSLTVRNMCPAMWLSPELPRIMSRPARRPL